LRKIDLGFDGNAMNRKSCAAAAAVVGAVEAMAMGENGRFPGRCSRESHSHSQN
jgi:hypothetical protein